MATIRFNEDEMKRIFTAAFEHGSFPFVVEAVRTYAYTSQDSQGYVEVTIKQKDEDTK